MSASERPSTGMRAPGRRLWALVVDDYDLDEHELALLREAVRTVDLLIYTTPRCATVASIERSDRKHGPGYADQRLRPAGVSRADTPTLRRSAETRLSRLSNGRNVECSIFGWTLSGSVCVVREGHSEAVSAVSNSGTRCPVLP